MSKSELEQQFDFYWRIYAPGEPQPVADHQPCLPRKWEIDRAWPAHKVAVEIEGGTWVNGRHSRGAGYREDVEKYNAMTLAGWRILRYTTDHLHKTPTEMVAQIITLLQRSEGAA